MTASSSTRRAGELDPDFGVDGVLTIELGSNPLLNIKVVKRTAQGELYVLCNSLQTYGAFLAKYSAAGVQDRTFAGGKGYIINDAPNSSSSADLQLQGDKPLIFSEDIGHLTIDRFLANGLPDPGFGTGGRISIPFDGFNPPHPDASKVAGKVPGYSKGPMLTVQHGNRWFVAFAARWFGDRYLSVLVCLNEQFELDLTFDKKGYTVIDLAGEAIIWNTPARLIVQTHGANAGKPVLFVRRRALLTGDTDALSDFIVRLNVDGSNDYTFGDINSNRVALPADDILDIQEVIADENDDLKVIGVQWDFEGAARGYTANGRVDVNFNGGNLWTSRPHDFWLSGTSTDTLLNYRLMTWGYNTSHERRVYVNRVNRDCEQDEGFGIDGIARFFYNLPSGYSAEKKTTLLTDDAYWLGLGPVLIKVLRN